MSFPFPRTLTRAFTDYHHRAIRLPRAARLAQVLSELVAQNGGAESLLDIGCSDGALGKAVADILNVSELAGVDVQIPEETAFQVAHYDGQRIPYDNDRFDVALLSDVLHHAAAPGALLNEALRVSRKGVVIKDHVRFGPLSNRLLQLMDHVGNFSTGVLVRGNYFNFPEWVDAIRQAGGQIGTFRWPLQIHDRPWRWATPDKLQFAAYIKPFSRPKEDN